MGFAEGQLLVLGEQREGSDLVCAETKGRWVGEAVAAVVERQ